MRDLLFAIWVSLVMSAVCLAVVWFECWLVTLLV